MCGGLLIWEGEIGNESFKKNCIDLKAKQKISYVFIVHILENLEGKNEPMIYCSEVTQFLTYIHLLFFYTCFIQNWDYTLYPFPHIINVLFSYLWKTSFQGVHYW